MISLLARLFIKPDPAREEPETRRAYGRPLRNCGHLPERAAVRRKVSGGHPLRVHRHHADAFNNLSDAGSSFVTLVGFQLAGQKPDSDHPFGHGRIEYISGLLVSILIVLMGFELVKAL